jgi:hypothetical protein
MDENKIKPTLLVVGDSFMTTDSRHRGQHWSEMVNDYQVINHAQSGCTNFMISVQVMQALKTHNIDAVVLGFTEENRLEFPYKFGQPAPHNRQWYTSGATSLMNHDETMTDLYHKVAACPEMMRIKSYTAIRSTLLTLQTKRIPYAWTPSLLDNDKSTQRCNNDPWWKLFLSEFESCKVPLNLATYSDFKIIPGYHTDSPEWQATFAKQAVEILKRG